VIFGFVDILRKTKMMSRPLILDFDRCFWYRLFLPAFQNPIIFLEREKKVNLELLISIPVISLISYRKWQCDIGDFWICGYSTKNKNDQSPSDFGP